MHIWPGKYHFDVEAWDGTSEEKLLIQSRLLECISTLHFEKDTEKAILHMLKVLGEFYGASRAYIFEYDLPRHVMNNTYEWCREGVEPQREYLKEIPIEELDRWHEFFDKGESLVIESLEENVDQSTIEYERLDRQNIQNLIAVPMSLSGNVIGFVGVDDPTEFKENHILLSSVAALAERKIQQKKIDQAENEGEDSLDRLLESNEDIRCAFRLNLTDNVCLSKHGIHGYAKLLMNANTADELFETIESIIVDRRSKERFMNEVSREKLIKMYEQGVEKYEIVYQRLADNDEPIWVKTEFQLLKNAMTGCIETVGMSLDYESEHETERFMEIFVTDVYAAIGTIDARDGAVHFFVNKQAVRDHIPGSNVPDFETGVRQLSDALEDPGEKKRVLRDLSLKKIISELKKHETYSVQYTVNDHYRRLSYHFLDEDQRKILFVTQDLTDLIKEKEERDRQVRVAQAEVERAEELKSDLLGNVSHDLRTPLNAILGYTSLVKKSNQLSGKSAEYLQKIENAGKSMLLLVNDTLDLRRLETGELSLNEKPDTCSAVMEKLIAAVTPDLDAKNLRFHYDKSKSIGAKVYLDSEKLQKILLNLLSNAIKFTPDGGDISLSVECVNETATTVEDRFTVSDTGIGMTEEFLTKIFEPFAQERTKANKSVGGSGLGLPITLKLVELMGGHIEVKSKVGEGSTFEVYITFRRVEEATGGAGAGAGAGEAALPLEGVRILLFEDNEMNTEIAVTILESEGATVDTAADGKEGSEKFLASAPGTYDVIISDIRMPVMDGYDAARTIRAGSHPQSASIPIIAISADAYESDVERSLEAGMNGHLPKPFNPELTIKEIRRLLKK